MSRRQREDLAVELHRHVGAFEAVLVRLARHARIFVLGFVAVVLLYVGNVVTGYYGASTSAGIIMEPALSEPVFIRRDSRYVPHISATSESDLFFAQGFVEASDRLFQMELTRRYALGTLAEVLGPKALKIDEAQRYYDVSDIVKRQWRGLDRRERAELTSFSDGVNAAMRAQPLPVEFHLLLYRPQPWRAQDSLAVSLAVSIALADSWHDVLARDAVWRQVGPAAFNTYMPLSDPRYDVSLSGQPIGHAPWPPAITAKRIVVPKAQLPGPRAGSNAWAAGALKTTSGRALLANDPHLDLTIPGLWYLIDLRAPGMHVAGASIPGAPGVLLGHNERVAWGATNGDTAAMTLYEPGRLAQRFWTNETFHVRFAKDVVRAYYRALHEFAVPDDNDPQRIALVRWRPYDRLAAPPNSLATFLALDHAGSVRDALRILAPYNGTAENFVLADTHGTIAYHLAGSIPDDNAWGRYVQPARDIGSMPSDVPFAHLPFVAPSNAALIVSANNRMYAGNYPYRLAATFDPPYRAYRIAQLLHAHARYDAAYFASMQLDTVSPADLELARRIGVYARKIDEPDTRAFARDLQGWNGAFSPESQRATTVQALRNDLDEGQPSFYAVLQQLRSGAPSADLEADLNGALFFGIADQRSWGVAGAVRVEHPLKSLPFGFLDGTTLPGDGNDYTIHLQEDGFSQSFRAVWDVGNWDAGGIAIPSGESGEPGSRHYTDLTPAWIAGRLEPLPFSDRAVEAATRELLILKPR